MSHLFGHPVPLDSVRSDDGDAGNADSTARTFTAAKNPVRALFRVDLVRCLQMHRTLALSIAIIGVTLAVAYFYMKWPAYRADSLIYVQPAPPTVLDGGPQRWPFDSGSYEANLAQEMTNVKRTDVLEGALHKLKPGTFQKSGESDQAAADRLFRIVEVNRTGLYQFTISAKAGKPERAAALSNAVTASYIESASREAKSGDAERLAILRPERDRVQSELTADRAEQQALNEQMGVAGIGAAVPDLLDDEIDRTRAALAEARTHHDEAEAKFAAMDAGAATASAAVDSQADQLASADPGLASMKTALNQRRAALVTQMASLTPNHPVYKQDAVELGRINSTLDSMTKDLRTRAAQSIQERLRTDLEQTAGVEERLNARLRELVAATAGATAKLQRSSDLAADITRLQRRYNAVDEQMHNLMLEDGAPGAVFLIAPAVPPLHPAKSSALKISVVMGLFSIAFGLFAAVAAHKMDNKLYIASDVEQVLGFAPMAQWPDFIEVPEEVAEESVLRLTAALEYAHRRGGLNSCMFTGTGPGAGTTTVATRVCNMLETLGRPSVLVDGARSQPSQAKSARQNSEAPPRAARSLAMVQQLAEEARMHDESLLITDSAPLAVSAETEYLARSVDCAIVVIASGVTTRAQLRATADALRRLDVGSVGFLMNRVSLSTADASFRNSIQEIETYLRHQKGNSGGRGVLNRRLGAPSLSLTQASAKTQAVTVTKSATQENVARTQPGPAATQPDASARNLAPPPAVRGAAPPAQVTPSPAPRHSSAPRAPERLSAVAPPPPSLRQGIKLPAPRTTSQAPAPGADPEMPWQLSETAATVTPQVPAATPAQSTAKARQTEPAAASLREAAEATGTTPETKVTTIRKLEAELLAARQRESALLAEQMRHPVAMETAEYSATRLSSLRNLLFPLGPNHLKPRETEIQPEQPIQPHRAEAQPVEPPRPFVQASGIETAPETSSLVSAVPELLSPQLESSHKTHHDRRDTYDEVEILPAWRGQYRRKS